MMNTLTPIKQVRMKERENPSTSVERAVAMLDAIGARSTGMTNAEISRTLKIPKSSASYILRALEKSGYLRRDEAKYRLGLKLLSSGTALSMD